MADNDDESPSEETRQQPVGDVWLLKDELQLLPEAVVPGLNRKQTLNLRLYTDTRFNTQKATSMRDPSQSEQYWQCVAFIDRTKEPLFFGEWEFYVITLDCLEETGIALNHDIVY